MRRSHLVLAAATTFTIIFLRASERPAHAQQTPPILIESLAGRDSFQQDLRAVPRDEWPRRRPGRVGASGASS